MITSPSLVDTAWLYQSIERVEADQNRSADTHLLVFPLPPQWGIDLYLKDESAHPTGSLKHRLARSLFLFALCNGWVGPTTTIIEASSGSTAVSEAYFARLLGLPFIAVMPRETAAAKVDLIEFHGGTCHLMDDPGDIYAEAMRLAAATGGHYMNQFTYAEQATDWRGNNNITESIFRQLSAEPHPVPAWIAVGAGTGGTSATIGRFVRYFRYPTRLCVADPEGSAFLGSYVSGDRDVTAPGSKIEGIGRPRVEPSFIPTVVDAMVQVPDGASIACMRWTSGMLGRSVGASTGTTMWAALHLVAQMKASGEVGSVVTVIGDGGERYATTYARDDWLDNNGIAIEPYAEILSDFRSTGSLGHDTS